MYIVHFNKLQFKLQLTPWHLQDWIHSSKSGEHTGEVDSSNRPHTTPNKRGKFIWPCEDSPCGLYRSVKNTPPLRSKSSQFFSGGFIFAKILSNFVLAVYFCQNFRIQIEQNWRFSTIKSIFGELIFQNFRLRRFLPKISPIFLWRFYFCQKFSKCLEGGF